MWSCKGAKRLGCSDRPRNVDSCRIWERREDGKGGSRSRESFGSWRRGRSWWTILFPGSRWCNCSSCSWVSIQTDASVMGIHFESTCSKMEEGWWWRTASSSPGTWSSRCAGRQGIDRSGSCNECSECKWCQPWKGGIPAVCWQEGTSNSGESATVSMATRSRCESPLQGGFGRPSIWFKGSDPGDWRWVCPGAAVEACGGPRCCLGEGGAAGDGVAQIRESRDDLDQDQGVKGVQEGILQSVETDSYSCTVLLGDSCTVSGLPYERVCKIWAG